MTLSGHSTVAAPTQPIALFGQLRLGRLPHLRMFHQPLLRESFGLGELGGSNTLGNDFAALGCVLVSVFGIASALDGAAPDMLKEE